MMATGNYKVVDKLKQSVQNKFAEIRKAVEIREKLLLRQIDVIASQTNQSSSSIDDIYFIPENEKDLLVCLRTFGKFNIDNLNFTNDLYTNEDYIQPSIDHETMHKCLDIKNKQYYNDESRENEEIIVNFSNNKKLIKDNVNNINESIIHITLNEAKKLIEKSKTNNISYDDQIIEKNHSGAGANATINKSFLISQSSQTDVKNKRHTNPNITINNCNGTINLKNISNLTINCVTQESFNIPDDNNKQSIESDNSNEEQQRQRQSNDEDDDVGKCKELNQSSYTNSTANTNTEIQSDEDNTNTTKDSENNYSVNCEFYDRLISEIKHTLKQSQKAPVEYIPLGRKAFNAKFGGTTIGVDSGGDGGRNNNGLIAASSADTTPTATTNDSYSRKLLLKNFENLKIVLENNENNDTHPVQIEQWLTEIISETEVEPMQNTDILEHSGISSKE